MSSYPTYHLGFDIGGTKTEAVVIDGAGAELWRKRVPSPHEYPALLEAVVALAREAQDAVSENVTVGIGLPGKVSRETGRVVRAYSSAVQGHGFGQDLSARLRRPVKLGNDANCFALSEAIDGAGRDAACVFRVILGTGVGGDRVLAGEQATPQEIIARMRAGERLAGDCFERYAENLARALALVMNVVDPDVIVLGGGLSNVGELYERVPQAWGRYVFSDTVATRLLPNVHGDSSGVRGAAWLGA